MLDSSGPKVASQDMIPTVRFRTLGRLTQLISSSLDVQKVLGAIAEAATQLLPVTTVSIWIADEANRILELRALSPDAAGADDPARTLRYGEGVAGRVAESRHLLEVPAVFSDERIVARGWFETHGLESYIAVPILFHDSLLGVLALFGREPLRLDENDQELLAAFVSQAGVAIRNARLYEDLSVAHQRLAQSQEKIVAIERSRAVGQMSLGLTHNFNNLLMIIQGRAELLRANPQATELGRGLDAIAEAARRGARLIRRLQRFADPESTRASGAVSLREVLEDVVALARPTWRDEAEHRGVAYEVRLEGDLSPFAAGRAEDLREVFTNVLNNALEAMPAGGEVLLRLQDDGDHVVVTVEDTGVGMSDETRGRAFEPFFTTKGPQTVGMGLPSARGIVNALGGSIDIVGAPGKGTRVTVRLIRVQPVPPSPDVSAATSRSGARVLVIEDDPLVREVLTEVLRTGGHSVVDVESGSEGLALCETQPFDVVLTDVSMPTMSGWDVAGAMLARFPAIPVGFITGWGDTLDRDALARHRVDFVVAKPVSAAELLQNISTTLSSRVRS